MKWKAVALLPVLVALCACEGGTRGSGISAFLLGNVQSVQPAGDAQGSSARPSGLVGAPTGSALAGIRVAIEGTRIGARTDANGNFSMHGNFEGMITVIFEPPSGGGQAAIALNVPAGGTLTLNDVTVDTSTGAAVPDSQQVEFDSEISSIDCATQTVALVSQHHAADDTDVYLLRLDTSTVYNQDGAVVHCDALRVGEWAFVQGLVNPDGSFGYATVDLEN